MDQQNPNNVYGLPKLDPQPTQKYEVGDSSKWAKILSVVAIVLILILAGFVVWLILERNTLRAQLSTIQSGIKDGTISVVQNDEALSNLKETVTTQPVKSKNGNEQVVLGKDDKQTLVGINTQSPEAELYIKAASQLGGDPELVIEDASGQHTWELSLESANKGRFALYNRTSKKNPFVVGSGAPTGSFFINDRGFIGLGTVTPGQRLQINGNVQIDGLGESGFAENPVCFDKDGVLRRCRE